MKKSLFSKSMWVVLHHLAKWEVYKPNLVLLDPSKLGMAVCSHSSSYINHFASTLGESPHLLSHRSNVCTECYYNCMLGLGQKSIRSLALLCVQLLKSESARVLAMGCNVSICQLPVWFCHDTVQGLHCSTCLHWTKFASSCYAPNHFGIAKNAANSGAIKWWN